MQLLTAIVVTFGKMQFIMINPFSYLFYKIHTFLSDFTFSGYSMRSLSVMGILLGINIVTVNSFFFDKPSHIIFIIMVLLLIPYAIPSVFDKVMAKYEKESERSRLIGNNVVITYIIASIISFILVVKK